MSKCSQQANCPMPNLKCFGSIHEIWKRIHAQLQGAENKKTKERKKKSKNKYSFHK